MIGAFLLTAFVFCALLAPWLPVARAAWRTGTRALRAAWMLSLVLSGLLLARPHGETVLGLDTTGYRLMSEVLAGERSLRGPDRVLQTVPESLRTAFLFLPTMDWRNTRDISFQLLDIHTCETAPFFYPWLPWAAAGFDRLLPGSWGDYFVPVLCWLFFAVALTAGVAWGGWIGLGVALALLLGTPLPAWFFRGFYPEAVASVLVGLALLVWVRGPMTRPQLAAVFAALGLAMSYHPLLVVLVAPAVLLLLLTEPMGWRRLLIAGPSFLTGFAPLYLMTRYVCQPYGDVFNWRRLWQNVAFDGKHAVVVTFTLLVAVVVLILAVLPQPLWQRLHDRVRAFLLPRGRALVLLGLALIPLAVTLGLSASRPLVAQGWLEVCSGTGIPLLLLLGGLVVTTLLGRIALRPKLLLAVLLATLPVFLYLKGSEPTGFWSQRRWLPAIVLTVAALLPAVSAWSAVRPGRRWLHAILAVLILTAAGANACRWPAPYVVRSDRGGDAWRRALEAHMANRLTFFDYFHHSFAFSVSGQQPVLGLGGSSWARLPEVMAWLAPRAQREPVLVATAWRNPGLEEGIELVSIGVHSTQVTRVHGKNALPADEVRTDVCVDLLEARPLRAGAPPVLRKVFDGGPLALRGPWLRPPRTVKDAAGCAQTAMWSRPDCGVIGPVPAPGGRVRVTVRGSSGRSSAQRIELRPPWAPDAGVAFSLPAALETVILELARPAGDRVHPPSGSYTFFAPEPYDPSVDGLRKYPPDLGALFHSVAIEVE